MNAHTNIQMMNENFNEIKNLKKDEVNFLEKKKKLMKN